MRGKKFELLEGKFWYATGISLTNFDLLNASF